MVKVVQQLMPGYRLRIQKRSAYIVGRGDVFYRYKHGFTTKMDQISEVIRMTVDGSPGDDASDIDDDNNKKKPVVDKYLARNICLSSIHKQQENLLIN